MPRNTIQNDCVSFTTSKKISELRQELHSPQGELANIDAAYIRMNNEAAALNVLMYFHRKNNVFIKITSDPEVLDDYDCYRIMPSTRPRCLTMDDLYCIYVRLNHLHIIADLKVNLLLACQSNRLISPYEEVILQMNERRMLNKPTHELHRFFEAQVVQISQQRCHQIAVNRRRILMKLAFDANSQNAFNRAVLTVVDYENTMTKIDLIAMAVEVCIELDKRDFLCGLFQTILKEMRKCAINYQVVSNLLMRIVLNIDYDEMTYSKVSPIIKLMSELSEQILKSKNQLPIGCDHLLDDFWVKIAAKFARFFTDHFRPVVVVDEPSITTFTQHCLQLLDDIEQVVPPSLFIGVKHPYQPLRTFFESLESAPAYDNAGFRRITSCEL